MLQKYTVATAALELLTRLMSDVYLEGFVLVGGTALALQLGHRKSIDLDLFCDKPFNESLLLDHLRINYAFELDYSALNTLKGEINSVKVDCLTHPYPWLQAPMQEGSIRLAGLADIAAMKLNAIAGNGTRLKDFIDLAYISGYMTLSTMLDAYLRKYNSNIIMPLKALTFFEDINFKEPISLVNLTNYNWKFIEKRLWEMQKSPDRLFPKL